MADPFVAEIRIFPFNLCAWFIPICGIPLSLVGLVLGFLGMKDETQKTFAIIALVVLGCTALEVVDFIFTMQLYSGLLP